MRNNNVKIIRIPRDPRAKENIFLREFPLDLSQIISLEEWSQWIDGLNEIIKRKETPSVWNFVKTITILPALLKINTYDKEVKQYLQSTNKKLNEKGIYIADPRLNGYTELEVSIIDLGFQLDTK